MCPTFYVLVRTSNNNYHPDEFRSDLIKEKTIHLRPFSVEDLDFLLRWNNDPEYSGEFEPLEHVSWKELKEWLLKEKPDQLWYIIETSSGEKIGQIVGRFQEDDLVQIGYRIVPSDRGRGSCT